MMKNKLGSYHVGEIANFFEVSTDTIRLYDKKGILSPPKNRENNYRSYSREDLLTMDYVMRLRKLGISIKEVGHILNDYTIEETCAIISEQKCRVVKEIENLKIMEDTVDFYEKNLSKIVKYNGKMDVRMSPTFICHEVGDSMIETLNCFAELNAPGIPLLTFLTHKQVFSDIDYGVTLRDRGKRQETQNVVLTIEDEYKKVISKKDFPKSKFDIILPKKCVHAVGKEYTNKNYDGFSNVIKYIQDNNFKVKDFLINRVLATENNSTNGADYYEVWIPIG